MGFVFFDVETTGLRPGFDQIVHFAALRTDNDLNVVEAFEVRSRLLPHVIPHPEAMLSNGLSIDQFTDASLPSHYEMMGAIEAKLLEWSPAIFLGYNSIGFDEEMLRHGLFQTLRDPYLTSKHQNSRTDVLRLALAAWAATPSCLSVPITTEGKATFKLELLSQANGIAHDRAHDAMADVSATLQLCRLVSDRAPEVWSRFVRFARRIAVADFVDGEDAFWLTEFYGNEVFHSAVVCLGTDQQDKNLRYCLNLELDFDQALALSDADLTARLHSKPSPIRLVRVNAAPAIAPLFELPDGLLSADSSDFEERAQILRADPASMARLRLAYVQGRKAWPISPYVEKRLYDGLIPDGDGPRMAGFHQLPWDRRLQIVDDFFDERLRIHGRRLIYFHRRSLLPDWYRDEVEAALIGRLTSTEADGEFGLGIDPALSAIDASLKSGPSELLEGLRNYLLERRERVSSFQKTRLTSPRP